MKKHLLKLCLLALCLMGASSALADDATNFTLTSTESSMVSQAEPSVLHDGSVDGVTLQAVNTQYRDWGSSDGTVKCNNSAAKITFYKFDLTDVLTKVNAGETISSATLKVTGVSSDNNKQVVNIRLLGYNGASSSVKDLVYTADATNTNGFKNSTGTITGLLSSTGSYQPLNTTTAFTITTSATIEANALTYVSSVASANQAYVIFAVTANTTRAVNLNATAELDVTTEAIPFYNVTFTENNGIDAKVVITGETSTSLKAGTYNFTATAAGYEKYSGSFTVEDEDLEVSYEMTALTLPSYTVPSDALSSATISSGATADANATVTGYDNYTNKKWCYTTDFYLVEGSTATISSRTNSKSTWDGAGLGTSFEFSESAIKYYTASSATSVTGTLTAGKWYRFTLTSNLTNKLGADQSSNNMIMTITDLSDNSVVATVTPGFRNSSKGIRYMGVSSSTGATFCNAYSYFTDNFVNNGTFDTNIAGWSTAGTQTKDEASTGGSGFWWNSTNACAEIYAAGNEGYTFNNDCYISQTVSNLPAGYYQVSAELVANGGNNATFSVNDGATNLVSETAERSEWTTETYIVNLTTAGSLTIKYVPQSGGSYWVGIDNVSLKYIGEASTTSIALNADKTYTTYCSNYALDFTDNADVAAYKAKYQVVDEIPCVVLNQVYQVPAGIGVILENLNSASSATVNVIASATALSDNELVGATSATTLAYSVESGGITTYNYVLSNGVFYHVEDQTILAAGKAYLPCTYNATSDAKALKFVFADDATAIQSVNNATTSKVAYNLCGQRVNANAKGIVIINGKKYMNK